MNETLIKTLQARDWFAGQAMSWASCHEWADISYAMASKRAFRMADAMLIARGDASPGITTRDWYAGLALERMQYFTPDAISVARAAYDEADDMMAARKVQQ